MARIKGQSKEKAPAAATARAKKTGCRGASKSTYNTGRTILATARTWTVDRFLSVVEVRA